MYDWTNKRYFLYEIVNSLFDVFDQIRRWELMSCQDPHDLLKVKQFNKNVKFMFLLQTYNKMLRVTTLNVFTCFEEQFIIARVYNGKVLIVCVNYVVIGSLRYGTSFPPKPSLFTRDWCMILRLHDFVVVKKDPIIVEKIY